MSAAVQYAYEITDDMLRSVCGKATLEDAVKALAGMVELDDEEPEMVDDRNEEWRVGGKIARLAILHYWRAWEQLRVPAYSCI